MQIVFILFSLMMLTLTVRVGADTECPTIPQNILSNDRRSDRTKLRLMQYNVEWLFIDYYSAMDCPGNGCTWHNQSEAQIHMDHVTKVIKELNPDIVNFCEVEGCDELHMLRDKLADQTYVPYLKKGTDTATGQNVGMLTRVDPLTPLYRVETKYNYPIVGSNCGYTGTGGSAGVSKHFVTEYRIGEYDIAFISAHLLALPTDVVRCAEREAQASVLQDVIYSYISRQYEVIMLGDFNDYDAEIPDVNGNKPLSKVLDILKGVAGQNAGKYNLHSLGEQIVQKERYSDWWDSDNNCDTSSQKDFSMIDHILVTDAIRENIVDVFVYHGYSEYCGKYDSDHFPVVVDFLL